MTALPAKWQWLAKEGAPKMLMEGLKLYGTVEVAGAGSNPSIVAWAAETGNGAYSTDSIAWCGLFCAVCAVRAGWAQPSNPLWALNWRNWGRPRIDGPMLGDVLVYERTYIVNGKKFIGGHVAMYVFETATHYYHLGGNQSDAVTIAGDPKTRRPIAIRQALWRIKQPANVRRIVVNSAGAPIGGSEA